MLFMDASHSIPPNASRRHLPGFRDHNPDTISDARAAEISADATKIAQITSAHGADTPADGRHSVPKQLQELWEVTRLQNSVIGALRGHVIQLKRDRDLDNQRAVSALRWSTFAVIVSAFAFAASMAMRLGWI